MNTKSLLSFVILSACAGAMGSTIPAAKRAGPLCPGTTKTVGTYLRLTDPTGTTDYGWITTGSLPQLADPCVYQQLIALPISAI